MSEKVITQTVKEFEIALRQMAIDRRTVHAFDVGTAPDGKMWSLLVIFGARQDVDLLARFLEKRSGVTP